MSQSFRQPPACPPGSVLGVLVVLGVALFGAALALDGAEAINGGRDVIQPQPPSDIEYHVGRVEVRRGETGVVDFSVRTKIPLKSLAVALDFDESRLRLLRVTAAANQEPQLVDAVTRLLHNNLDTEPGNQLSEGWVVLKLDTGDRSRDLGVSTGELVPLFTMEFEVNDPADFGFSAIRFRPIDFEESPDLLTTYKNQFEAATVDAPIEPVVLGDENFEDGGIEIIGEVGFFMRGDANFDFERNLSDPVFTLNYFFRGGSALLCQDAADANDDGGLDISDAVFMLTRMYLSTEPFPEPVEWGPDPTADPLGCEIYTE